ncbi:hypothetical protein H8F21_22205 [Pseudomonas sp. P66]|uniref:Uncharacterized protein n=1 Tax=Pseudomonas arcuscaelestis TaxID=2710591 RepID=A0ABS2C4W3_9PSED|nr:hypothetical protein [Pseudomonas arcuscaelestis]MBM5460281.1 hypothetical protein [Pseudomonas arcuscaelestis]
MQSPADGVQANESGLPLLTAEKAQLDSNLEKLRESVSDEAQQALSPDELSRRYHQIDAMSVYSEVLGNRIKALGGSV